MRLLTFSLFIFLGTLIRLDAFRPIHQIKKPISSRVNIPKAIPDFSGIAMTLMTENAVECEWIRPDFSRHTN